MSAPVKHDLRSRRAPATVPHRQASGAPAPPATNHVFNALEATVVLVMHHGVVLLVSLVDRLATSVERWGQAQHGARAFGNCRQVRADPQAIKLRPYQLRHRLSIGAMRAP